VTFKDLVRLLRRRWMTALLVFAACITGFMGWSFLTERPQFRARARVIISTPPILLTATQGTQWISVTQMDPKTWISIASSQLIRELSTAAMKKKQPTLDVTPDWFSNVTAILESDGQLAWIEAVGPDPVTAAAIANVVAEQLESYSKEIASRDLNEARRRTAARLAREK
jgi:capsular polysaccharide biosynthesis protein